MLRKGRKAPYTRRGGAGGSDNNGDGPGAGGAGSSGAGGGGPMRASGRRPVLASASSGAGRQAAASQQQGAASTRTWRSSALRERLQHFLMESPARPYVEQQQQQQRRRPSTSVLSSGPTSQSSSFLGESQDSDQQEQHGQQQEKRRGAAETGEGTRAREGESTAATPTSASEMNRSARAPWLESSPGVARTSSLNLSTGSLSTTRDEAMAALEHRVMSLEAEKIDLRTAKLHAEHELKAVKAQLQREQIELARLRDAREKDSSGFSQRVSAVERQRDFLLEQVERLDKELKDTLDSLTKAEQQHHSRMKEVQSQLHEARTALSAKERELSTLQQQHISDSHTHQRRVLELESELKAATAKVQRLQSRNRSLESRLAKRTAADAGDVDEQGGGSAGGDEGSVALRRHVRELKRQLAVAKEQLADAEKHQSSEHLRTIRRLQDEVRHLKQSKESGAMYKEKFVNAENQLQRKTEQLAELQTQTMDYEDLKAFHETWKRTEPFVKRFLYSDPVKEEDVLDALKTMQSDLLLSRHKAQKLELENGTIQQKLSEARKQLHELHTKYHDLKETCADLESSNEALERQIQYLRSDRDKIQDLSLRMVEHQESFSRSVSENKVSQLLKEQQEHNKKLEAEVQKLQVSLSERDKELTSTRRRLEEATAHDASRMEKDTAEGKVDPSRTKILHLKSNPIAWAEDDRKRVVARLKEERDDLKARLARATSDTPTSAAAPVADPKLEDRVKELEHELKQRDIRVQRLKEVFNNNVREFREACYELLGYQIDVVQASRYRLHSMYAESSEDYLLFASSPQGLQLLETKFSASLDERIMANLHRFHSIPAFLSAITMDLFSKTTLA